ncbi:hypothetical protein RvY_02402 [Ramazzottius varieornatus]|uniref:Receptor ligand binding region domain-containing protein n=1 Tax=Ramazzottius varieornatus TaxID=947166 RepID=A0A1D1URN7_RAMVA|nr:hypothetical protein RvY_02402 [Ramazzottius varieornatus]
MTDESLRNKKRYPTVISLTPVALIAYAEVIGAVLDSFAWTSVYTVRDEAGPAPFYQLWIATAKGYFAERKAQLMLRMYTGNTAKNGTAWFSDALQEAAKYSRGTCLS